VDNASAGFIPHSDVLTTIDAGKQRVITKGCVKGARRVGEHGSIAEGIILSTVHIAIERVTAVGVVVEREAVSARVIVKERKCADSIVVTGDGVKDKRIGSNGYVL